MDERIKYLKSNWFKTSESRESEHREMLKQFAKDIRRTIKKINVINIDDRTQLVAELK